MRTRFLLVVLGKCFFSLPAVDGMLLEENESSRNTRIETIEELSTKEDRLNGNEPISMKHIPVVRKKGNKKKKKPTSSPTSRPSLFPSTKPSVTYPSWNPSAHPSQLPSNSPSSKPSNSPSSKPSNSPSSKPSNSPSSKPSYKPTAAAPTIVQINDRTPSTSTPTTSAPPSVIPTHVAFSSYPSITNSSQPSSHPTSLPTARQTINSWMTPRTNSPTVIPSPQPTKLPSSKPSYKPTAAPTELPSEQTSTPTNSPTAIPSPQPTKLPSSKPSSKPTAAPTKLPSEPPTSAPKENQAQSAVQPSPPQPIPYSPGNLTTLQVGLLLSKGLNARLLSTTGEKVVYADGSLSERKFHGRPDGGATFPDTRPNNPGGWIYVSNSEMQKRGDGGVGALTFDKFGNTIDYRMVLEDTTMNCGGGRTPWDTWVSCEEVEFDGLIYQVDPTGGREPQLMTLGSSGGRWESFAYDIRDSARPHFYATEDHNKGTVRRFTPDNPDWNQPWDMLHGTGVVDFLMIFPNSTNDGGTFAWTNDKLAAKNNARSFYPQTEGIDVYGSQMFFVCKRIRQLFTINLDDGTYSNRTTASGLFDGKPDSMQRILGDASDLLYFTEEGGEDAGVHARDHLGRFYTVLESPIYRDETSGLSFSPDGRFLYVAYQENGKLFAVWRDDGKPFQAAHLDVKFHQATGG